MPRVTVYSSGNCSYCTRTKTMLEKWGIAYDEVRIDDNPTARQEFAVATNGANTVPQIFIDGNSIGGFTELTEWHMDGKLDELMQSD